MYRRINSLNVIEEAEQYFSFKFKMVQSDNGLEFARYFETRLESEEITFVHNSVPKFELKGVGLPVMGEISTLMKYADKYI